ncbi:MAG: helix-turn-helix transcriptional regulator [Negativibacillus sp.]
MIIATKSLAKRRIEQGLSRSELARTLSLSHSVIVRAEQHKSVSPKTAKIICDFFKVAFDEIFEIEEVENSVATNENN